MKPLWKGEEPCRVTDIRRKVKMAEFTVEPRKQTTAGLFSLCLNPRDSIAMSTVPGAYTCGASCEAEPETTPLAVPADSSHADSGSAAVPGSGSERRVCRGQDS